eukprot:9477682-Pyramimonas_sp.AAC.1
MSEWTTNMTPPKKYQRQRGEVEDYWSMASLQQRTSAMQGHRLIPAPTWATRCQRMTATTSSAIMNSPCSAASHSLSQLESALPWHHADDEYEMPHCLQIVGFASPRERWDVLLRR